MDTPHSPQFDLQAVAKQSMIAHGFLPDFTPDVEAQANALLSHPSPAGASSKDLRALLWSSIDNDTSRDLDQIEFCERLDDKTVRVLVGIADVDALASCESPIDLHAQREATTVYTGVRTFPMLPEQLSTGITSLLENEDRLAVVVEYTVRDGELQSGDVYSALVRNKAQLTYDAVGAWLEGTGPAPGKVAASPELQSQLKLQDEVAQQLKLQRHLHGALEIDRPEFHPILKNGQVVGLARQGKNHATDLIEDFMVASNETVARLLESKKISFIRRVVKTPERWPRIVELAQQQGEQLPATPDSKALSDFLANRKQADPDHFADLSLAVVKLMGPGEYVLQHQGATDQGHFGLAVQDYTHSTAPNRRFADLLTQRILKATSAGRPAPYSDDQLTEIARNCTLKGDAARKVEREVAKHIAALAMRNRIGETFDAIVTGVTPAGTFVRVLDPHIEGMLVRFHEHTDVGDRIKVKLVSTDVQRGYIDFERL
jgi:VacB/RNase II family 3'-5' exoribonuclease